MLLCLLLLPLLSVAQKYEIGLNGGVAPNSIFHVNTAYTEPLKPNAALTNFSAKFAFNHKCWQLGLAIDYRKLRENYIDWRLFPGPGWSDNNVSQTITKAPVILFANRKLTLGRIESYAGLSAGYVLGHLDYFAPFDNSNGGGYAIGAQAGASWFVTKHVGINAEVGVDYIHLINDVNVSYVFSYPLMIGVRYRL
jgi:hypothetical protein